MSYGETTSAVDRDQIAEFLGLLYSDACDDGYQFGVVTLPRRQTRYFDGVGDAVDYCARSAESGHNVYCTMGVVRDLSERIRTTPGARANKSEVAAIVAMWADIDIDPDAHDSGKRYPATLDEAAAISRVGGCEPSVIVQSGGGMHAYMLLDEPREIRDRRDRDHVALLCHRWGGSVASRARERGYQVDAVHDLGRILRVAGTTNFKGETPRPVRMLPGPGGADRPRYNLDDLEAVMVAPEYIVDGARLIEHVGAFAIDPDVVPDLRMIESACENDPEFAATWRRDREFRDQSCSAYDLSLATQLVRHKMTDQEIVDALVYWRREIAKAEPKNRIDYYQRTIGKARSAKRRETAVEAFSSGSAVIPDIADPANVTGSDRQAALEHLREALGIRIARIVQVDRDDGEIYIELDSDSEGRRERFSVGPASKMMLFRNFKARIAERCGVVLSQQLATPKTWDRILQTIYAIKEQEDSLEPTAEDRTREIVAEYIESCQAYDRERLAEAISLGDPILVGGEAGVHATTLHIWLHARGWRTTLRELRRDLRLMGFTQRAISATDRHGKRRARKYWLSRADNWQVDHIAAQPADDDLAQPLQDSYNYDDLGGLPC